MKRRLFFLAALVSFLLFLATCLSLFQEGPLPWMWCVVDGGAGVAGGSEHATIVLFVDRGDMGIGWTHSDVWFEGSVHLPVWAVLILSALLPAWWLFRLFHPPKRRSGGCAICGYDLRAHHPGDKCPECGTLVPPEHATIPGERNRP